MAPLLQAVYYNICMNLEHKLIMKFNIFIYKVELLAIRFLQ